MQELERKRVSVKKELQRYAYLRARINKAVRYFEDFEYEEYKNREIEDVRAFLFSNSNYVFKYCKEVIKWQNK